MYQLAAGDVEEGPFRDLIIATASDWSDAGWVMQTARASGLTSPSRLRQLSIGMIAEGLALDVLVAGDADDRHRPWPLSASASIERIVREWPAAQPVPSLGAIAWFDLTPHGEALAAGLANDDRPNEDTVSALTGAENDISGSVRDALATRLVDARAIYDLAAGTGLRRGSEIRQLALGVIADLLNDDSAVAGEYTNGRFVSWALGVGESSVRISERWTHWGSTEPEPGTLFGLAHRDDA